MNTLEQMSAYRAWLKLEHYWERDDTTTLYDVQKAIETLIKQIIKFIPRTTGNHWAIAKIHEQLHIALNILFYGAHRNVHTGPQEHNHIENTKKPAKQVQRKKALLDWQISNRLVDKYVIDLAHQEIIENITQSNTTEKTSDEHTVVQVAVTSSRFHLKFEIDNGRVRAFIIWNTRDAKSVEISSEAIKSLHEMFGDDIYSKQIQGYTELKKGKVLYQVDINYQNKGCWFDNVMVLWESSGNNSSDDDSMKEDVSSSSTLIFAEIRLTFQIEGDDSFYALVHLCH